jgi:menaquinone-specific isochorismate synthase
MSVWKATTRALPDPIAKELDLIAFAGDGGLLFTRDGVGLAARGEAFRIPLPHGTTAVDHVRRVLGEVEVDDPLHRAASGAVAIGALQFVPQEPSEVIVPSVLVAKSSDGTAWVTHVHPAGTVAPTGVDELVGPTSDAWSPHGFDLHSTVTHQQWCDRIAAAVDRINDGPIDKVVLARAVDVVATEPLIVSEILGRLHALFPSCMVFHVEGFLGASPELLVSRKGSAVRAHPLAGTIARSGDPDTDARLAASLLASTKDRWEHSLVIDAMAAQLRPLCDELDVPRTPTVLPLRNVAHLATLITGTLRSEQVHDRTSPTALELAALLHPTPAVGGVPTDLAIATIAELEPVPRGRYAGPVGWVDAAGNGEWAVGLRSAQIDGNRARMHAGGGIVADSNPHDELTETQLKLQALLAAVVRP